MTNDNHDPCAPPVDLPAQPTANDNGRSEPRAWLWMTASVVLALDALGVSGAIGWLLYDDVDPTQHAVPLIVLIALCLVIGLTLDRLLCWLMS